MKSTSSWLSGTPGLSMQYILKLGLQVAQPYFFNLKTVSWGLLGPQATWTADIFVIGWIYLRVIMIPYLTLIAG